MTAVLVDSKVIPDILTEDPKWFAWPSTAMKRAGDRSRLVIDPIVYGEVSARFSRIEELVAAIPSSLFAREPIPFAAAVLAANASITYRYRGGMQSSPLLDFLAGALAAIAGYDLFARDRGRFKTNLRL